MSSEAPRNSPCVALSTTIMTVTHDEHLQSIGHKYLFSHESGGNKRMDKIYRQKIKCMFICVDGESTGGKEGGRESKRPETIHTVALKFWFSVTFLCWGYGLYGFPGKMLYKQCCTEQSI